MGTFAVNAYGVYCNITFPLIIKVFKPKKTLNSEDKYRTKIELASEIITELGGVLDRLIRFKLICQIRID